MRRRTAKEVPKTHRRNKVDSVESEQEPLETPSNKPNVSMSTVVRMKQLAKRQASTRETKSVNGEIYNRHVHRTTTPEPILDVPTKFVTKRTTRSVNVQPSVSQEDISTIHQDTANLNKELWKVRDQLSGLQLVVNGIPNKQTLIKDVISKIPKPDPVEPLDVDAVKKEITETVTKVVMESLPKPADLVEPLDVEAVKKEITETVTKALIEKIPQPADPVEPLDVEAVKNTILTSAKQDSVAGITLLREDLMCRIQELTNKVEALTHIPSSKPSGGESMMDRLLGVEKEIRTLCLRIDEIGTNKIVIESGKHPSSYSRTRERKDVDSHRLSRLPMFAVELAEDMVIEGGTQVYPLIRTPEWIVSKDSENTFHMDNGYYVAPFHGNYNVFTLLKTVSTSVTAHISVEHRDKRGSIRKVYAIDQSSLTDESTGQVMLMDVNTNDQIAIMIQTRFNMKLVGSKMLLQEETGKEYPEIYNMVQITYSPYRGFCEVPPTEEDAS